MALFLGRICTVLHLPVIAFTFEKPDIRICAFCRVRTLMNCLLIFYSRLVSVTTMCEYFVLLFGFTMLPVASIKECSFLDHDVYTSMFCFSQRRDTKIVYSRRQREKHFLYSAILRCHFYSARHDVAGVTFNLALFSCVCVIFRFFHISLFVDAGTRRHDYYRRGQTHRCLETGQGP